MARDADTVNFEGLTLDGYHQPIPGYEILERIGSGGMGSVYKTRQLSLDRIVALKVLRKDRLDDPRSLERMKKEARLLARFDHPNIVRSIDMGEAGPYVYFAMELVDGKSLKDLLGESGPLNELVAVRIVEKVALALEQAAQNGITHRDVKPGNILLGRGGVVKLSDFGLALGPLDTGTRSGTLGTPQYISPEQAKHPKRIDVRSDLFSLGATFYHMLTGQPPFPGESVAEVITAVLFRAPKSPDDLRPGLHPTTSRVLARLMAKSPRLRYQTPRALLDDLDVVKRLLGGDVAAGDDEIGLSWAEAGSREPVWWRQPVTLATAGGLLVVVALAVVLFGRSGRDRRPDATALQAETLRAEIAVRAPEALVAFLREHDLRAFPDLYQSANERVRGKIREEVATLAEEAETLQTNGSPAKGEECFRDGSEKIKRAFFGDSITPSGLYNEMQGKIDQALQQIQERNAEIVTQWEAKQTEYLQGLEHDVTALRELGDLGNALRALERDPFPPRGERTLLALSFVPSGMQAPSIDALPPEDSRKRKEYEQNFRRVLRGTIQDKIDEGKATLLTALENKGKRVIAEVEAGKLDQPFADIARRHVADVTAGVSQVVFDAAKGDVDAFRQQFVEDLGKAAAKFVLKRNLGNEHDLDLDFHVRLSERDYATATRVLEAGVTKGVTAEWLAARQTWLAELKRIRSDALRALNDRRGETVELKAKGGVGMTGVVVDVNLDAGTVQLDKLAAAIAIKTLSADSILAYARRKGAVSPVGEALLRSSDDETAKAEEALKDAKQDEIEALRKYWDLLTDVKRQQRDEAIDKIRVYEQQADDAASDQDRQMFLRLALEEAAGDDEQIRTIRDALRHRLEQVAASLDRTATEQKMKSLWHGDSHLSQDGMLEVKYAFDRTDELQDFAVPGAHYRVDHGALVATLPPGGERGNLLKQTTGVIFPSRPAREMPKLFDPKSPMSVAFTVTFPYDHGNPDFFGVEVQGHCFGIHSPPDLAFEGQLNTWEGSIDAHEAYFFDPSLGDTAPKKGEVTPFRLRRGTRYSFLIEYDPERHELVLKIDNVIRYRKQNATLGKGRIELRPARPFVLDELTVTGRPDPSWYR